MLRKKIALDGGPTHFVELQVLDVGLRTATPSVTMIHAVCVGSWKVKNRYSMMTRGEESKKNKQRTVHAIG